MKRLWVILYLLPLLAQNSSSQLKVIQQDRKVYLRQEAGYILAMQTVFIGTSILSSKKKVYGHLLVSGFDLFMSVAGIKNASNKQLDKQRNGYYMLGLGFLSKSIYNAGLIDMNHSSKTKFHNQLNPSCLKMKNRNVLLDSCGNKYSGFPYS